MEKHKFFTRGWAAGMASALALFLATSASFAASEYVGKYTTKDTQGKEMTIMLSEGGAASGQRANESLKGTWKEKKGAAVVKWEDGWVTQLSKDGNTYKKTAYEKGKKDQADTSEAQKVQ